MGTTSKANGRDVAPRREEPDGTLMRRHARIAVAAVVALGLAGCATTPGSQSAMAEQSIGIGCALGGGAAGAAAGQAVSSAAGGVIGGGIGAVIGSLLCGGSLTSLSVATLDTDGDGHPDDTDTCPATPLGAGVDAAGCPVDSDDDGVPDYLDDCPGTAAGVRVDVRGCGGDTDADGDGVPDAQDKCPNTPPGVKVDADGCPEVGETLMILENIEFEFDKSTILPDAAIRLDQVARTLEANPQMKVRLEGHTDNVGTADYNQALSERRANAASRYLASVGIDTERMSAVGKGEDTPLAANTTREGRARNRRVEFIVTAK